MDIEVLHVEFIITIKCGLVWFLFSKIFEPYCQKPGIVYFPILLSEYFLQ